MRRSRRLRAAAAGLDDQFNEALYELGDAYESMADLLKYVEDIMENVDDDMDGVYDDIEEVIAFLNYIDNKLGKAEKRHV